MTRRTSRPAAASSAARVTHAVGLPVYVFLLPLAGILNVYANNSQVEPTQVLLTLLVAWALTVPVLWGGKWILGDLHKAALILGIHYVHLFLTGSVGGSNMAKLTLALLVLSVILLFAYRDSLVTVVPILNVAALALVVIPSVELATDFRSIGGEDLYREPAVVGLKIREDAPRNIFFILVDGYARSDVLEKYYGAGNRQFEGQLEGLGFHVAARSWANYSQTALSLASLFNLDYVDRLIDTEQVAGEIHRRPLHRLINSSIFVSALKAAGYEVVAFKTGYSAAELKSADKVVALGLGEFPLAIVESSSAARLIRRVFKIRPHSYANHRRRVVEGLGALPGLVDEGRRRFVFAHFISPHPPFVLGAGGDVTPRSDFTLRDGSHWHQSREEKIRVYRKLYMDQLKGLNRVLLESIRAILETSRGRALIFLFSDHGPGSNLHHGSLADSDPLERMANFQAVYGRGMEAGDLYPNVSLINAVRATVSHLSTTGLRRLPDRLCVSEWQTPYVCHDVTKTLIPGRRESVAQGIGSAAR